MDPQVVIITAHGLGDQMEGLKCARHVSYNKRVKVYSCARDEVFTPLNYLFSSIFDIEQLPESYAEGYQILHNHPLMKDLKGKAEEIYFVAPDLLYRGPYAFDYQKYNVSLPVIKQTRLLTHKHKPRKEIYLGLMSTTPGYLYSDIPGLALRLAANLPDYLIHLPILTKWANQDIVINGFPIPNPPENLKLYFNPDFLDQLEVQRCCEYGVYSCNGMSHSAHHLGQTRTILDPRFGKSLWESRWKENPAECIDINTTVTDVVRLVLTHVRIPQTTMIPHSSVLNIIRRDGILRQETDWSRELGFKF